MIVDFDDGSAKMLSGVTVPDALAVALNASA